MAIAAEKRPTIATIPHWIGGARVPGTSGRQSDVFNPSTGQVSARVALASAEDVAQAVEVARAAFPEWANTPPLRRARVMYRFRELLEASGGAIAKSIATEHGK